MAKTTGKIVGEWYVSIAMLKRKAQVLSAAIWLGLVSVSLGQGPNPSYSGFPSGGPPPGGFPSRGFPSRGFPNSGFPNSGFPRGAGLNFEQRFMTRDTNGDGKLTQAELPESIRALFPRIDSDNNGWIDAYETDGVATKLSHLPNIDRLLAALTSNESPPASLVEQVRLAIELADETADRGAQEIASQRRSEWLLYVMSLGSMLTGVISFGHILTSHPPGRARWHEVDASPDAIRGVVHSAAYISILSALDLFWTNARASDLRFLELNPFGSLLLADGVSLTAFKLTAVMISVLLLLRLRRFRAAQTASWWLCLVCTLVTFRWLMLDSALLS